MSETPQATYHVWRSQILELTAQQPRTGGIAELRHWFGRASLNPMTGKRHSLRGADLHSWYVRSWRRPRYLLTPHMTHLSIRAASDSGAFVRIRVLPFAAARPLVGADRGSGADVLAYTGPPAPATVTVSNAAIWFADPDGTNFRLLTKCDGPYEGPVQLPGGPGLLAIETSGRWSVELQRRVGLQISDAVTRPVGHTASVESFRCATCGTALSIPVQVVELPAGPHWSLLSCHHVNPPRLEPGTYAIDDAAYGRDQVVGTFVLSPGDVRGTRFVHDLVLTGCWSLVGWSPCLACELCGAVVASRTDDCNVAQETRFYPSMVVRETGGVEADRRADPFALFADWDETAPDTRQSGWAPEPVRPRPELVATRWGGRRMKVHLYRDDPPA